MKNIINLFSIKKLNKTILLMVILAIAFSVKGYAQQCGATLFMREGNTLEYINYDKKGKALSKATHTTMEVDRSPDVSVASMQVVSEDLKKDQSFTSEYQATCREGLFSIDMARFLDVGALMEYDDEEITVEISGNVLEFPVGVVNGDRLNDGSITVRVAKTGFTVLTIVSDVKNRKVHGIETITTPAGTFACRKVTFDFYSKVGILRFQGSGIEWYQDNHVLVRSESYNKKGRLTSYSELESLSSQ